MDIKDYTRSARTIGEEGEVPDSWKEEQSDELKNKRFSGRFDSERKRLFRIFLRNYSSFVAAPFLIFVVAMIAHPGQMTPEEALYAMHGDLAAVKINPVGDYIDKLVITGTITPNGALQVREEFILHAVDAAAKSPIRREISRISVNVPMGVENLIHYTVSPRAFEVERKKEDTTAPVGGLGELTVSEKPLSTTAIFGTEAPGKGEYKYTFYYSVDNFKALSIQQGSVFFELGQRFNIPIKEAKVLIHLGKDLVPAHKMKHGPVVVKEYGNTTSILPSAYISLARLNPALAGINRKSDGSFQVWGTLRSGIPKYSSLTLDFKLHGDGRVFAKH